MRRIQDLAAAANITDTSTTQISEYQDTIFAKDVIKYMEDFRFLQNAVDHDIELIANNGKSKRLFFATSHLDVTKTKVEGDTRTFTEMTNLDSVDATPTWDLGAIAITKELVKTCAVDLIELAKYMIAQDAEQNIEEAIVTEIETASTNNTYGGDAVSVASLETGDTITPSLVIKSRGLIRNVSGFPKFLFIAPQQETALIQFSDFINASEYGGREVVLNGEIGKYIGMKVIVTENVNEKTNGEHSWGVTGHQCFILGQNQFGQNAGTLVWKEKPKFTYEYLPRFTNHYIYRDAAYAHQLTNEKLVSQLFVTDA